MAPFHVINAPPARRTRSGKPAWARLAIARCFAGLFVFVTAGSCLAAASAAGECCARCGDECRVHKVCRPVHATRQIEVTCWDVVCEEICMPGGGAACPNGKIRTRQKLVRKTFLKEAPVVTWVVEYVCASCISAENPNDGR